MVGQFQTTRSLEKRPAFVLSVPARSRGALQRMVTLIQQRFRMSPAGISAALVLNFLASTLCLGAEASVGRADAIDSRGGLEEREDALPDAGDYTAAVPNAWFALAYNQVRAEGLTPPVASRVFGYLGVALYESVVHGIPGSRSLQGQLNGLHGLPRARGRAYHWPTVATASLATTMRALFEGRPNAAAPLPIGTTLPSASDCTNSDH